MSLAAHAEAKTELVCKVIRREGCSVSVAHDFLCFSDFVVVFFFFLQIVRRRAISFWFQYKVPVNKNENDGIKLNGIIIAINQPTGNGASRPFSMLTQKEKKGKLLNVRKIKRKFRKTNKRRWDEPLTYFIPILAKKNEFRKR